MLAILMCMEPNDFGYVVKADSSKFSTAQILELGKNYQGEFTESIRSRYYKFSVR